MAREGVITIFGLTPEEFAKDYLTTVQAGPMDLPATLPILLERVAVGAITDYNAAILAERSKRLALAERVN